MGSWSGWHLLGEITEIAVGLPFIAAAPASGFRTERATS
jgi:hypothetical protein